MSYNAEQQLSFNTAPTSNNTLHTGYIEKERVIVPVIFIPGVMGSNLKVKPNGINKKNTQKIWRMDSEMSLMGWMLPYYGDAKARKLELDPDKTMVDDRGKVIDASDKEVDRIKRDYDGQIMLHGSDKSNKNKVKKLKQEQQKKIDEAIKNNPENALFGSRKARGWGTVGFFSYGKFLDKLQKSLFDQTGNRPEEISKLVKNHLKSTLDEGAKTDLIFKDDDSIKHCDNLYFPVHAMGYNWLESNDDSAESLKELIEVALPRYYKKRGKLHDKVILITHSMGGLVARCYTQVLGGEAKVLGVIHGVQPATGAVAAYTRMKRGTEVNTSFLGKPVGAITENILGKDAAEMTAVCAQAPGPLQLLPTPEYGAGWLQITDPAGNKQCLPKAAGANGDKGDLYNNIYLAKDKWWGVCEPHLINPLNTDHNKKQMENDWNKYEGIINDKVRSFNESIANQYHPNTYAFFGLENEVSPIKASALTYHTACWQGKTIASNKTPSTPHIGDPCRLNLKELTGNRTLKNGNIAEKYTLLPASGNGDGTVPQRSGEIPIEYLTARMHFPVEHEPAYQKELSQDFTLRAIVDMTKKVLLL